MKEEKAAILLLGLGSKTAEEVLQQLGPEKGKRVRAQMDRLGQSQKSQEIVDQVLREFQELIDGNRIKANSFPRLAGGRETADRGKTTPPVDERRGIAAYTQAGAPDATGATDVADLRDPLDALSRMTSERLAAALTGEHSRTVALVLAYLAATKAGEVLKLLPPEARREVSLRLGNTVAGDSQVLCRIARALLQKSRIVAGTVAPPSDDARSKRMADMLRMLEKKERMEILTAFDQQDPETAAKVKELLYQFEDLLLIEDRSMQKVLAEIDSKNLAVALKNAPETIKEKVLNNLSKRAQETLSEEMEFLGPVPADQIRQAQAIVVEVIQRLDQAGELVMAEG